MVGGFNILLWLHILALTAAGTALFGEIIVRAHLDTDNDPAAKRVNARLGMVGGIGFLALIVTGILMIWLNGYDLGGMGGWFWVKMGLLVAVFAGMFVQGRLASRPDEAGSGRGLAAMSWIMRALFVAVIAAAVMAFG